MPVAKSFLSQVSTLSVTICTAQFIFVYDVYSWARRIQNSVTLSLPGVKTFATVNAKQPTIHFIAYRFNREKDNGVYVELKGQRAFKTLQISQHIGTVQ